MSGTLRSQTWRGVVRPEGQAGRTGLGARAQKQVLIRGQSVFVKRPNPVNEEGWALQQTALGHPDIHTRENGAGHPDIHTERTGPHPQLTAPALRARAEAVTFAGKTREDESSRPRSQRRVLGVALKAEVSPGRRCAGPHRSSCVHRRPGPAAAPRRGRPGSGPAFPPARRGPRSPPAWGLAWPLRGNALLCAWPVTR